MSLTVLALNCTLKPDGASSTHRILELALGEFPDDCEREIVRVAALDIKPGVSSEAMATTGPRSDARSTLATSC